MKIKFIKKLMTKSYRLEFQKVHTLDYPKIRHNAVFALEGRHSKNSELESDTVLKIFDMSVKWSNLKIF